MLPPFNLLPRLAGLVLTLANPLHAQHQPYEEAPILYSKTNPDTPLTRIFDRIKAGEALLQGKTDREILAELLLLLGIPIESQVLVFSKTSSQNARISPQTPRAIYFSDNAYIGWVQNGNIEAITFDPSLGAVFHLINLDRRKAEHPPELTREPDCLRCHASPITGDHPGLLVRSIHTERNGKPLFDQESYWTDHTSPIEQRWGGWYVTGEAEQHQHLGNLTTRINANGQPIPQHLTGKNSGHLDGVIDTSPYLAGGQSDIVALMVLEHQILVHNALISANQTIRRLLHQHRTLRRALNESEDTPLSEPYEKALQNQAERIVRAVLLADEAPFEEGINGSEDFQDAYQKNAPSHPEWGSLKTLRLHERLFKYRCSPLVYSDCFHALDPLLKKKTITRMLHILGEETSSPDFPSIPIREKLRILEILQATHPDFSEVANGSQ